MYVNSNNVSENKKQMGHFTSDDGPTAPAGPTLPPVTTEPKGLERGPQRADAGRERTFGGREERGGISHGRDRESKSRPTSETPRAAGVRQHTVRLSGLRHQRGELGETTTDGAENGGQGRGRTGKGTQPEDLAGHWTPPSRVGPTQPEGGKNSTRHGPVTARKGSPSLYSRSRAQPA